MSQSRFSVIRINILEVKAAGRAARMRAAECPSTKQLYRMDSSVGIGFLAKGRSASRLLYQELRTQVPDLIGHDHYSGYLFTPTRLNSAGHPARGRAVPPPDATRGPQCWDQVPRGEFELFDAFARLRPQRRAYAEWIRLTLRICLKYSVGFPLDP